MKNNMPIFENPPPVPKRKYVRKPKPVMAIIPVPEQVQINWQTPIADIFADKHFDNFLLECIMNYRNMKVPEGRHLNKDLEKVIDLYSITNMKINAIFIFNKISKLPSSHRKWISHLVEQAIIQTVQYYEKQNSDGTK